MIEDDILAAEAALKDAKRRYLIEHGWKETCNTPGAFWLWVRDFSDVDAERLAWWGQANGPYGKPSKPEPIGRITAPIDLAVAMTTAALSGEASHDVA